MKRVFLKVWSKIDWLFSHWPNSHGAPLFISVCLHGFLLLVVTWGWQSSPEIKTINTPNYVQAELIQISPKAIQKKATTRKNTAKPKPVVKSKAKPEIKQKVKPKSKQKDTSKARSNSKLELEKKLAEKKNREAEEREKLEQEKLEQRQAEKALAQALADEETFQQEQSDLAQAQSYAHLIKQQVEQSWSRPPSTKYGMSVLLEIQLVPTGFVVGVSVLKSSGNAAFDLSAQQAVRKVEQFIETKTMPSRLFESHFRRFQLLFKPEDKLS